MAGEALVCARQRLPQFPSRLYNHDYLTTEETVRAAGGVGPDDRLEVAAILPKEGLSFVTSDPRTTDVEAVLSVARHGAKNMATDAEKRNRS